MWAVTRLSKSPLAQPLKPMSLALPLAAASGSCLMDLCNLVCSHWCRQPHRWGTEEVETERRVLDAFRAVHFFEQGAPP